MDIFALDSRSAELSQGFLPTQQTPGPSEMQCLRLKLKVRRELVTPVP